MTIDEQFASEGRGVTATVKYGSGFEQPWLVFHGSVREIQKDIINAFGFEEDSHGNLHELVLAAVAKAQGDAPASQPKGRSTSNWKKPAAKPAAAAPAEDEQTVTHDEAVANVETGLDATVESEESAPHPHAALLTSIAEADSKRRIAELLRVDANKAAYASDPDVKEAVKTKMGQVS